MTTDSSVRQATLPTRADNLAALLQGRRSVRKYQAHPVTREHIEQIVEAARILNAPAIIIPCLYLEDLDRYPDEKRQNDETTMAIQSLGAAIQNMLLMAYDLGLDTGWMCAPLFCPEVVCEALELDTRLIPHALITVGYAAAYPQRHERLPLSTLIVRFD